MRGVSFCSAYSAALALCVALNPAAAAATVVREQELLGLGRPDGFLGRTTVIDLNTNQVNIFPGTTGKRMTSGWVVAMEGTGTGREFHYIADPPAGAPPSDAEVSVIVDAYPGPKDGARANAIVEVSPSGQLAVATVQWRATNGHYWFLFNETSKDVHILGFGQNGSTLGEGPDPLADLQQLVSAPIGWLSDDTACASAFSSSTQNVVLCFSMRRPAGRQMFIVEGSQGSLSDSLHVGDGFGCFMSVLPATGREMACFAEPPHGSDDGPVVAYITQDVVPGSGSGGLSRMNLGQAKVFHPDGDTICMGVNPMGISHRSNTQILCHHFPTNATTLSDRRYYDAFSVYADASGGKVFFYSDTLGNLTRGAMAVLDPLTGACTAVDPASVGPDNSNNDDGVGQVVSVHGMVVFRAKEYNSGGQTDQVYVWDGSTDQALQVPGLFSGINAAGVNAISENAILVALTGATGGTNNATLVRIELPAEGSPAGTAPTIDLIPQVPGATAVSEAIPSWPHSSAIPEATWVVAQNPLRVGIWRGDVTQPIELLTPPGSAASSYVFPMGGASFGPDAASDPQPAVTISMRRTEGAPYVLSILRAPTAAEKLANNAIGELSFLAANNDTGDGRPRWVLVQGRSCFIHDSNDENDFACLDGATGAMVAAADMPEHPSLDQFGQAAIFSPGSAASVSNILGPNGTVAGLSFFASTSAYGREQWMFDGHHRPFMMYDAAPGSDDRETHTGGGALIQDRYVCTELWLDSGDTLGREPVVFDLVASTMTRHDVRDPRTFRGSVPEDFLPMDNRFCLFIADTSDNDVDVGKEWHYWDVTDAANVDVGIVMDWAPGTDDSNLAGALGVTDSVVLVSDMFSSENLQLFAFEVVPENGSVVLSGSRTVPLNSFAPTSMYFRDSDDALWEISAPINPPLQVPHLREVDPVTGQYAARSVEMDAFNATMRTLGLEFVLFRFAGDGPSSLVYTPVGSGPYDRRLFGRVFHSDQAVGDGVWDASTGRILERRFFDAPRDAFASMEFSALPNGMVCQMLNVEDRMLADGINPVGYEPECWIPGEGRYGIIEELSVGPGGDSGALFMAPPAHLVGPGAANSTVMMDMVHHQWGVEMAVVEFTPAPSPSPSSSPTPSITPSPSSSSSSSPTPSIAPSPSSSPTPSTPAQPADVSSVPSSSGRSRGRKQPLTGDTTSSLGTQAEACTDILPSLTSTAPVLVQTSVTITDASISDVGCESAEAFVNAAVAVANLDAGDAVFWLEVSEGGQGTVLVLQLPADSAEDAAALLQLIEPQLGNSTNLDVLTQGVGADVEASYANDGSVVDSPYLPMEDSDEDLLWLWIVIVVAAVAMLGAALYFYCCCSAGLCRREREKREEEEDKQEGKASSKVAAEIV